MNVYRASRRPRGSFDPLDASASVARSGWRFNDRRTAILYTAEVQALAILEVAARPGWETVTELWVASIELPEGSVVDLDTLGLVLPSNWNCRPAAPNARSLGAEFLAAVDIRSAKAPPVCGLRVPSVLSSTDHTVLLDPRQRRHLKVAGWQRLPFDWLLATAT